VLFFILSLEIFLKDEGIVDSLIKEGYLNAEIFRKNDSIFVRTGNLFYIGNVKIKSSIFYDTLLLKRFYLKRFSEKNINLLADSILFYFSDNGFPFSEIIPEFSIIDSIVDIEFNVKMGKYYRICKILLKGNIKNRILLKDFFSIEGKPYSRREIIKNIEKVNSSNFLKVDSFKLKESGDTLNIILFIQDVNYGDISGGLSFQNNSGWNFLFSGDFFNPFGFGTRWNIRFNKFSNEKSFLIKCIIPILLSKNFFNLSYSLFTSSDTLLKNNFRFSHIYVIKDFSIGNGVKYQEVKGLKKNFIYELYLSYRKSYLKILTNFNDYNIFSLKTISFLSFFSITNIFLISNKNLKEEENFFPLISGYPNTYNELVFSSTLSLYLYNKNGYKIYTFFAQNFYPEGCNSTGVGISKDRITLELSYPLKMGIRNIMFVLSVSPFYLFDNP